MPEGTPIRSFGGVLPDPLGEHTRFINRQLKQLKEFASHRALVLLGEPGMGKSFVLEAEVARRRSAGEHVEHLLLREYLTPGEVAEAIREAAGRWRELDSSGDLTLVFDGFDEPLFAIRNLAHVMKRELERLDRARLRVLITSRRSAWQQELGGAFARWWPDGATASLVLAPLTEQDIRQAAATELDDPDGFVTRLKDADVQLLAASPMTLRLLLAVHARGGMPSRRSKIYTLGVEGLAADIGAGYAVAFRADPPVHLRLKAARRLASVSLLSGRKQIVWRSDLLQGEGMLGLDEVADDDVDLQALEVVFGSALLTESGAGRGWTHRSVQEFLTAQQCEALPLASVRNLLADPAHPERVLPQLAGVAAWLAALRSDVTDWLTTAEPEVLMQADLRDFTQAQRARVAEAIVAKVAATPMPDIRSGYAGLLHPGLAAQLAPLLEPGELAWRQREAVLIVQATGLRDLDERLMDLVERGAGGRSREDYDEDVQTAEWAARALQGTQDGQVLERARSLAAEAARPWPVRAAVLNALWPDHVDMAWLLEAVAESDRTPHRGMGRRIATMLARQDEAGGCRIEDLAAWVAPFQSGSYTEPVVRRLLGRSAWRSVSTDAVGSSQWRAAAGLLYALWVAGGSVQQADEDGVTALGPERRRHLVKEVVGRAGNGHAAAARMLTVGLVRLEDLPWWLDDLQGCSPDRAHSAPAFFALYALANVVDDKGARRVVAAAEAATPRWTDLAERFAATAHGEQSRRQTASAQEDGPSWDAEETLRAARFGNVVRALQHPSDGAAGPRPVPAWPDLTTTQQQAIAERAVSFLSSGPDAADEVTAELIEDAHQIAEAFDGNLLDRVPAVRWGQWLPGLWNLPGGYRVLSAALGRAMTADEDTAIGFLDQKMRTDAAAVAFHQGHLRSERLSKQALALIADGNLPAGALPGLLDTAAVALPAQTAPVALGLLQHASSPASRRENSSSSPERDTAVAAGACLVACPMSPAVFDSLMHVLEGDLELAQDIIRRTHRNSQHAWASLTLSQRGRLYLWANQTMPRKLAAPGTVVPSDPVDDFPSQLLGPVFAEPSAENAVLLEELAEKSGRVWLRADAVQMRDAVRAQAWRPPTPGEVLDVLTTPSRRIITSQEQFAAVLAEALEEIAGDLRADRAVRAQLWHRQRQDNKWVGYVPLEEREVSDWLARELQRRLRQRAAVLREVEINPNLAGTQGDIPDLLAVAHTTGDRSLSVPCEVKCSWHREFIDAIRDQLGLRYLAGPNGTAGVYVAVYFSGSVWDSSDSRRGQYTRRSVEQVLEDLHRHATELAAHGITAHVCLLDASLNADARGAEC
ncbi:hypothetical protein ACF07B_06630 [Streptomyces sp. NPDC015532]|uniref:hypothetical protein n=1 Tax=Streptomyces sp. NPDC015532 TaxID=3364960 RepID=UPI0036FB5294